MRWSRLGWVSFPIGVKIALIASVVTAILATTFALTLTFLHFPFAQNISLPLMALLLAVLIISALTIVLILVSRRYVDEPLNELANLIQSAEKRGFLLRSSIRRNDSIGRLSDSFNRLMERITMLDAFKLETERELVAAQEEIKYKKALEEKNRHLSLLYQISKALTGSIDSENIYQKVLDIVGSCLGYQELALLLHNEEAETLKVVATYGMEEPVKVIGLTFKLGEGVSSQTVHEKQPIYIPDTTKDDRYLYYKGKKPEEVSFLSVPLITENGDRVVAVLNLSRPVDDPFKPQERETLQVVAQQLAIAIVNARLYARMRELSVRDELTQLYNRRHCQETMRREAQRAKRFRQEFSCLMLDIDYFKQYNDRYGHPQGDEILKEFSHLIRKSLRDVDSVARWGGEEFVVLLPNTDRKGGLKVAEKLRRLIRNHPFPKRSSQPKRAFTVSIGLATYPEDSTDPEELIEASDKALYEAKRGGRDRVVASEADETVRQVG